MYQDVRQELIYLILQTVSEHFFRSKIFQKIQSFSQSKECCHHCGTRTKAKREFDRHTRTENHLSPIPTRPMQFFKIRSENGGNHQNQNLSNRHHRQSRRQKCLGQPSPIPSLWLPRQQLPCMNDGEINSMMEFSWISTERASSTRTLHPGQTKQWTLKIGYVVPIRCDQDRLAYFDSNQTKCWYPFRDRWSPGQVVSVYQTVVVFIYQTEAGEWKMQIRWFNRFRDMIDLTQHGRLGDRYECVDWIAPHSTALSSLLPGRRN